jgi:hypothetical protein
VVFRKPVNKAKESPEVCGCLLCGSGTAASSAPLTSTCPAVPISSKHSSEAADVC